MKKLVPSSGGQFREVARQMKEKMEPDTRKKFDSMLRRKRSVVDILKEWLKDDGKNKPPQ